MAGSEVLNSVKAYSAQPMPPKAAVKPQTAEPKPEVKSAKAVEDKPVTADESAASAPKLQPEEEKGWGSQSTSAEQLKKAIAEMNKRISEGSQGGVTAVFGVHEDTERITIKILDKKTKEVLKEFPPEKALDMLARIWEIAGILVDEKL